MNQPNKEQIQWLWEQCGYTGKLESIEDIGGAGGKLVYVSPSIDLNNLFKYAVPIAIKRIRTVIFKNMSFMRARKALFDLWLKNIEKGMSDEDALFQAIYKALGGADE